MNSPELKRLKVARSLHTQEAAQVDLCIACGFSIEDYRNAITKELAKLANEIKLEEDKPNVTY